jgi:hypothetical protein
MPEGVMGKIVIADELSPEIFAVLEAWGVPKRLISLDLHIEAGKPVEITCTFYPEKPDGSLVTHEDALVQEIKRFNLVAAED